MIQLLRTNIFGYPPQTKFVVGRGGAMKRASSDASVIVSDTKSALKIGQAIKSARGMPWHQEPTKDVTSCDKLRGGANIH